MKIFRLFVAIGALLLLSACSGGGGHPHAQASPRRSVGALSLQEVAPQRLSAGQCALVLWSKAQPPLRVLVAFSDPNVARIQFRGKTMDLLQTARGGEMVYGHAPRQSFEGNGIKISIDLEFDARSGLVGGAIAPSGTLEMQTQQGWSAISPVAGLVACQPSEGANP